MWIIFIYYCFQFLSFITCLILRSNFHDHSISSLFEFDGLWMGLLWMHTNSRWSNMGNQKWTTSSNSKIFIINVSCWSVSELADVIIRIGHDIACSQFPFPSNLAISGLTSGFKKFNVLNSNYKWVLWLFTTCMQGNVPTQLA